jgi:hypothetical protein
VLRAVHARRHELNVTHWELFALRNADSTRADPFHQFGIVVTHWELFALRDADSTRADPFHQFGIVRDDYSPNRRSSDCARPSPSPDEAYLFISSSRP